MSAASGTKPVSREKLLRIFSRLARGSAASARTPVAATDCDWTAPHHFGPDAIILLDGLARRVGLALAKCLEESAHKDAEVIYDRLCEHYAARLSEQISVSDGPYTANLMNESQHRIGCVVTPFETAVFLVAQTLHDPEAAVGQDGLFSALEESILADLLGVLEETLTRVLNEYAQLKVQPGQAPARGEWQIDARQMDDLCELRYRIRHGGQEYPFSVVLESRLLDPFAGQPAYFKTMAPEKTQVSLLEQVRRASVLVSAVVCETTLDLGAMMELEPGDILLLGKKVHEPMDVLVNGQSCFRAYPAARNGKLALVITEAEEIS